MNKIISLFQPFNFTVFSSFVKLNKNIFTNFDEMKYVSIIDPDRVEAHEIDLSDFQFT